jgi:hypothetical protein
MEARLDRIGDPIWMVLPPSRIVPHVCRRRVPTGLSEYQRDDLHGFGGHTCDSRGRHDFPCVPPRVEVEDGSARPNQGVAADDLAVGVRLTGSGGQLAAERQTVGRTQK